MTSRPTALLAEDEPLLARALESQLAGAWPELALVARAADGPSALQAALAHRPDVCFLDIRMPGATGLEVAEALAEDWPEASALPAVVFVTAYEEYAVRAFEAQAVDYLLKPVDAGRLAVCVRRLQARLAERTRAAPALDLDRLRALLAADAATPQPRLEVVQAQLGPVVHLVPVDEVLYFHAEDKYVRVVTAAREHLIRTPLRELLPQLDPARFWQVHRSTVVQARCIVAARRDDSGRVHLTLRDRPETLIASRLYAHRFRGM